MKILRPRSRLALSTIALGWLFSASPALACPVCHTELGEQVREAIFGPDFIVHLLAVLSPFPVLAGLVIALHFAYRLDTAHPFPASEAHRSEGPKRESSS